MESSKHGISKSEVNGGGLGGDDQSVATNQRIEGRLSLNKIKSVFKALTEEGAFLIEEKVLLEISEGNISDKEAYILMVDSLRKSLSLDSMEDIELLVNTFADYSLNDRPLKHGSTILDGLKEESSPNNRSSVSPDRFSDDGGVTDAAALEDQEIEVDPDDIFQILEDFQRRREEKLNQAALLGNPRKKKRSNAETDTQRKERIKKEEKLFWEKLTTVLSESKQSVWNVKNTYINISGTRQSPRKILQTITRASKTYRGDRGAK